MNERDAYIQALHTRLEEIKATIETDRQQLRELQEVIENKQQQAEYIIRLLEAENVVFDDWPINNLASISVSDIAFGVFSSLDEPRPIHYRELAERIIAEGHFIPGQDPAANLISHLSRDDRFVRVGRGIYALKEWRLHPPRKSAIRKRRKKKR